MRRLLFISCAVAFATCCSASGRAAREGPSATVAATSTPTTAARTRLVHGRWVNSTPAVSLGITTQGFKQRSGTTWTGDLEGTTTYVAYTRADPAHAGGTLGDIDEIFTGSVRGVGRGRLYLNEQFTVAAKGGAIRNVATIKRGDGGLTGVTGALIFVGTLDVNADGSVAVSGLGSGTYTGTIQH